MNTKQFAKTMKALSNEKRLLLFKEIAERQKSNYEKRECFVSNIMGFLKLTPPTISHHLKELSNADLITTEKKGKFLVASINKETLESLKNFISSMLGE
jgi:DNA-binding transcriptional ArsR family regulator